MSKQVTMTAEEYRKLVGIAAVEKVKPPEGMNKTEAEYYDILSRNNHIVWLGYEPLKFRLANNTTYTPDFVYVHREDGVVAAETKGGFFRDDARAKWKIAAGMYPWLTWMWVQKKKGVWISETYGA